MKGIIVAAGYGTRFLPATKSLPKEMLPLLDKPALALIIEEFINSGIRDIIIVTSRRKQTLENFLDRDPELEEVFTKENAQSKLEKIRPYEGVNFCFVRQQKMLGSGDALLCCLPWIGNEPVITAYPDDLHFGETPLSKQLIDHYEKTGHCVCAAMEVRGDISRYGVFSFSSGLQVNGFVEKPASGTEPSRLASIGRYLLTPEYFTALKEARENFKGPGEFYHVEGLHPLIKKGLVDALPFSGMRVDTGEPAGYLEAILYYAAGHDRYRETLRAWCKDNL